MGRLAYVWGDREPMQPVTQPTGHSIFKSHAPHIGTLPSCTSSALAVIAPSIPHQGPILLLLFLLGF